jgi:hypothetical protein
MPDNGPPEPLFRTGLEAPDAVTPALHFRYSEIIIAISNNFYGQADAESIALRWIQIQMEA